MEARGRVLVVGCGYVGSRLGEYLLRAGWEVLGLRRTDAKLPVGVSLVQADVVSGVGFENIPEDIHSFVYAVGASAHSEVDYNAAYVEGVRNTINFFQSRRCPPQRAIFVSSTGVYSENGGAWVDEDSDVGGEYFASRLVRQGEMLFSAASFSTVSLRCGGIYGPERALYLRQILSDQVQLDPTQIQFTNRIHRDDCCRAIMHLLDYSKPEAVYNVVDDEPADRNVILDWLSARLGKAGLSNPQGAEPAKFSGKRCKNHRLRATGFSLLYPSFREGYEDLIRGLNL